MRAFLLIIAAIVAVILLRARNGSATQQPATVAATGIMVPATTPPVSTFPPSAAPPPWQSSPPAYIPGIPRPGIYPVQYRNYDSGIYPIDTIGGAGVSSVSPAPISRPLPTQTVTIAGIARPIGIRGILL